jgi:acyl carrier protein
VSDAEMEKIETVQDVVEFVTARRQ